MAAGGEGSLSVCGDLFEGCVQSFDMCLCLCVKVSVCFLTLYYEFGHSCRGHSWFTLHL